MKPHNAYDIVKYARDFEKGNTIMKNYRDPQSQMCCINDARLINFAVGEPKPGNLAQIHDEVMKKLECLVHARRHNACIEGYPILQAASIVTAMTTSADHVTSRWSAGSEFEESNITDTEHLCEVIEESTDTEMVWQTHTTLMITSDREKVWLRLEALIKEQDCTINEAVRQVQEWHLEEVQAITDAIQCQEDGRSSNMCRNAS